MSFRFCSSEPPWLPRLPLVLISDDVSLLVEVGAPLLEWVPPNERAPPLDEVLPVRVDSSDCRPASSDSALAPFGTAGAPVVDVPSGTPVVGAVELAPLEELVLLAEAAPRSGASVLLEAAPVPEAAPFPEAVPPPNIISTKLMLLDSGAPVPPAIGLTTDGSEAVVPVLLLPHPPVWPDDVADGG